MEKEDSESGWVFKAETKSGTPKHEDEAKAQVHKSSGSDARVSWSASEYIANPKNVSWFTLLGLASAGLAVVVYLITQDVISVIALVILAAAVGVFAAHQPRTLEYHVDEGGVRVGEKLYSYSGFKSFSVVAEGAFGYISLTPLKRFMPPLAIHYAPEDEEKIISTLADYLPYEEYKRDLIENFSRRIRF